MVPSLGALFAVMIILATMMALGINHVESFTDRCDVLTGFVDTIDGTTISTGHEKSKSLLQPQWSQKIKSGKVMGGYSNGRNHFVCQGFSSTDGVLPGETWSGHEYCNIGNAGNEEKASKFNLLDSNQNLYWSKFPNKKIVGGKQSGVDQHVCRGRVDNDMHIGRTWAGYDQCNVGLKGLETPLSDFEYLSHPADLKDRPMKMATLDSVDSVGNDISAPVTVADDKTCETLCKTTPACHVASYSKSGNQCWLKHGIIPNSLKYNTDITGFAKIPDNKTLGVAVSNTDYPGNDMAAVQVGSQESCNNLCAAVQKCNTAAWDSSGSQACWIKSSRSAPVANGSRQSWTRSATSS